MKHRLTNKTNRPFRLSNSYQLYYCRRFGFPNITALDQGQTGMACRGEEHEVVLVWSVTSGKRTILQNGQEVFYSHTRGSKFEHSWTMRDGRICKVIAYDFPDNAPSVHQYEFFIHGQSFFKVRCFIEFRTCFDDELPRSAQRSE